MPSSKLEKQFLTEWNQINPDLRLFREFSVIHNRRFRFDFIHFDAKVAIEIQGGTYAASRLGHSSGVGLHRDYEKLNLAQLEGWEVYQLDCKMITRYWIQAIADKIRVKLKINLQTEDRKKGELTGDLFLIEP